MVLLPRGLSIAALHCRFTLPLYIAKHLARIGGVTKSRPHLLARVCALAATACCVALPAQQPFLTADYLPDGYRNIVVVDFAQLRDTGVWDEIGTGAVALGLRQFEQMMEVKFDDLDSFTMVPRRATVANGRKGFENLMIVRGSKPLEQLRAPEGGLKVIELVGDKALRYQPGFSYGTLAATDRVHITGQLAHLRARAKGPTKRGHPCPDLLSLVSARKKGLLGYVILDLVDQSFDEELKRLLPDETWPEQGGPEFGMLRVAATDDPDDPHLRLEVVLRHRSPGAGVALTAKAVKVALDQLNDSPRLRTIKKAIGEPRHQIDGSDVSITFDLGRARTAASLYERLGALFVGEVFVEGDTIPGPDDPKKKADAAKEHKHR